MFAKNVAVFPPKWLGKCPGCQSWNSFVEETIFNEGRKKDKVELFS